MVERVEEVIDCHPAIEALVPAVEHPRPLTAEVEACGAQIRANRTQDGVLRTLAHHAQACGRHQEHGSSRYPIVWNPGLSVLDERRERRARLRRIVLECRESRLDLQQVIGNIIELVLWSAAASLPRIDMDARARGPGVENDTVIGRRAKGREPDPHGNSSALPHCEINHTTPCAADRAARPTHLCPLKRG